MEKKLYLMMINKTKTYNRLTKAIIEEHVENLRNLDDEGYMEFCGVLKGWVGVAGMVILKAESKAEAEALCKREPLVIGGFATYTLCEVDPANRENNYLL